MHLSAWSSMVIRVNMPQLVDKDFKDWILPSFTTTTDNDTIVCAAAMMATLKSWVFNQSFFDDSLLITAACIAIFSYFVYEGGIVCGIPSITLEGTQKDWLSIFSRLDKLEEFGVEPTFWAALLRPILSKFVQAFDGEVDAAFWKTMVDRHDICGGTIISGWITAFGIWSDKGQWRGPAFDLKRARASFATVAEWPRFSLDLEMMPVGFFDLELKLIDDLEVYECIVVAGHIASLAEGAAQDTIRPLSGWFVFTKADTTQPITRQAKLKAQEWPKAEKPKWDVAFRDKEAKRDMSEGDPGEPNGELSHGSGCFCIKSSMFASILSLFHRR